jgi:hypothetical protein
MATKKISGAEREQDDFLQLAEWIEDGYYDANLAALVAVLNERAETIGYDMALNDDAEPPPLGSDLGIQIGKRYTVDAPDSAKWNGAYVTALKVNYKTVTCKVQRAPKDSPLAAGMVVRIASGYLRKAR